MTCLHKHQLTASSARRRVFISIRELTIRFGNTKAKDREGVDHGDSDVESDSEHYDNVQSTIVVEDWVGPISATLEVWHMVDDTAKLRQPPIVSPHYYF
jgi:hypothetical protein